MEEGVHPQSSWTFKPATPALHWSCKPGMPVSLPLPIIPQLTGRWSTACIILRMLCFPGVQFAAIVAVLVMSARRPIAEASIEHTLDLFLRQTLS